MLSVRGFNNQRLHNKQTLPHSKLCLPAINSFNTCYAPQPPANIARPSFGSDMAARPYRAMLRAAVVQVLLLALNMSTVLTAVLAAAHGISNQRRQHQKTLQLAGILNPKHTLPAINGFNTYYAPPPPAIIASPSFGSDVAARAYRATLRAAVVHIPLVALKMST